MENSEFITNLFIYKFCNTGFQEVECTKIQTECWNNYILVIIFLKNTKAPVSQGMVVTTSTELGWGISRETCHVEAPLRLHFIWSYTRETT